MKNAECLYSRIFWIAYDSNFHAPKLFKFNQIITNKSWTDMQNLPRSDLSSLE